MDKLRGQIHHTSVILVFSMLNMLTCFEKQTTHKTNKQTKTQGPFSGIRNNFFFFIFIDCKLARTGPPATIVPIDEESRNGECTSVLWDASLGSPRSLVRVWRLPATFLKPGKSINVVVFWVSHAAFRRFLVSFSLSFGSGCLWSSRACLPVFM